MAAARKLAAWRLTAMLFRMPVAEKPQPLDGAQMSRNIRARRGVAPVQSQTWIWLGSEAAAALLKRP